MRMIAKGVWFPVANATRFFESLRLPQNDRDFQIEPLPNFAASSGVVGTMPVVKAGYPTTTTGAPSTSIFGAMPSPGDFDAAMRPFTRCGAPSAVLTVT